MTVATGIGNVAAIFGSVTAAIGITNAIATFWKTGPGRRRVWAQNFSKLAPFVRPSYVEQLFGKPTYAYVQTGKRHVWESGNRQEFDLPVDVNIWPLGSDGFLMTWSVEDSISAYSLTTTSRRFHPTIPIGDFYGFHDKVRLGRTRFSQLRSNPEYWHGWRGAHTYAYFERFYFGYPGGYRTWWCGLCDAGYRKHMGELFSGTWSGYDLTSPEGDQPEARRDFRNKTAINSVLVQIYDDVDLQLESIGPPVDKVRVLSRPNLWDRWRVRLAEPKFRSRDTLSQP